MQHGGTHQNAELHSIGTAVEGEHEGALSLLALIAPPLREHLAQALPVQVESHLCHGLIRLPHLLEPAGQQQASSDDYCQVCGRQSSVESNSFSHAPASKHTLSLTHMSWLQ